MDQQLKAAGLVEPDVNRRTVIASLFGQAPAMLLHANSLTASGATTIIQVIASNHRDVDRLYLEAVGKMKRLLVLSEETAFPWLRSAQNINQIVPQSWQLSITNTSGLIINQQELPSLQAIIVRLYSCCEIKLSTEAAVHTPDRES